MSVEPVQIDCRHRGRREVVGAWRRGADLVDPGPSNCLDTVLGAIDGTVARVLVTHVHLDHAGGVGELVRHMPDVEVVVHRTGAAHLADPTMLWAGADDVWDGKAAELWGPVTPVPEGNLHVVEGGETLDGGVRVIATPGHARHHVAFVADDVAFVGDAAGMRFGSSPFVLMPTVPSEFDEGAWLGSIDALARARPARLALAHYGMEENPATHLASARRSLIRWAAVAREADGDEFARRLTAEARSRDAPVERFLETAPPALLARGVRESRAGRAAVAGGRR